MIKILFLIFFLIFVTVLFFLRKFSSRKIITINFFLIIFLSLFFLIFFFSTNDQKIRENYHPPTFDGEKVIPGFFDDEDK